MIATGDFLRALSEIVLVVLLPLLLWNARMMVGFAKSLQTAVADFRLAHESLRHALYGAQGDNGLTSEVRRLRAAQHDAGNVLIKHGYQLDSVINRLGAHGEQLDDLDKRLVTQQVHGRAGNAEREP